MLSNAWGTKKVVMFVLLADALQFSPVQGVQK